MCVAGGKRCEYPDALANVRRKVRNRFKDAKDKERNEAVATAIREFQNANPDFVQQHLPEKESFNYVPPSWDVPDTLIAQLGNPKDKIKGVETYAERLAFYRDLVDKHEAWVKKLSVQENGALTDYTGHKFEEVNLYLRGKGYRQWFKDNEQDRFKSWDFDPSTKQSPERVYEERIKPVIEGVESAMSKLPENDEPQKLYRYHRIPGGITPQQYIGKYLQSGTGFKDKGYLSTSADPEFMAAHLMNNAQNKKNTQYVVFEILSKDGGSMQREPDPFTGRYQSGIQPLEAEVLLPRNKGMRVIDSATRTFEFAKNRSDMQNHWRPKGDPYKKGKKISVQVVRMIDEDLIREERKKMD